MCPSVAVQHIVNTYNLKKNQGIMNAVKLSAPLGSIGIIYPTNKEAKKPKPCIHCDKIPQVFEKTRNVKKKKKLAEARVFYISIVLSNARRVISQ